jgi:hypothetical protein
MKRVLSYGLPTLNVVLLVVLLAMMRGIAPPVAAIDIGFPIVNFALLVALFVASRGWSGPSQDLRLRRVEDLVDRHEQRLGTMDHNVATLFRDLAQAITNLTNEVHVIAQAVPRIALLENRATVLEVRNTDLEQQLSFLGDVGCGYPGCPRYAAATREKGGGGDPKETKEE